MKIICIHRESRLDRKKQFEEGVGKHLDYEYLCVDKADNAVVSDYYECLGDMCCRASHAKCWLEAVRLQQNVLIFEDDVQCEEEVKPSGLQPLVDATKGDQVMFFSESRDTHAYVVTPESAAILLHLHLDIVSPVNMVQLSVDHRIHWTAGQGYIQSIFVSGYNFWQVGDRESSDNEWNNPISLGKKIIYP